jgi:acyl-CoA thioesterase II
MHCYFVLAGDPGVPIVYHVERLRDGLSFSTRTVQARQKGKPIFTTTMSFVREEAGGEKVVRHAARMPEGLEGPWEDDVDRGKAAVESWKLGIVNGGFALSSEGVTTTS